ncbi:MAG TPA: hypothetical protein VHY77_03220 [Acidimicrobiales bacterium]|nr:hypothetical protein [Acidimicrobiales bacterium]
MSPAASPRPRSPRSGLIYGPAALNAGAQDDRLLWALHRAALVRGLVPVVPAMAVAEAMRTVEDPDALTQLLTGTQVESLDVDRAERLGALAASAGTDNLVTVAVVESASRLNHAAVTERSPRLAQIATALDHQLILHAI